jgi:phage shock protein C
MKMTTAQQYDEPKRLYKSRRDRMIDGVCGGIAEYFDIDPTIVRGLFILLVLFGGTGLFLYIGGMIVMPVNPYQLAMMQSGEIQVNNRNVKRTWGVILVIIGILFLVKNFGWFAFHHYWQISWGLILPIIFILIGMALIYSHQQSRGRNRPEQGKQQQEGQTDMNTQQQEAPYKRLYKSRRDRKLFGVCGGLGDYFNLDPTVIRILFILLTILSFGTGIILYIAMAIFVPDEHI